MFASMKKALQTLQKFRCTEFETTKITADSLIFYGLAPFGGAGSPSNIMSPGSIEVYLSIPCEILIHPAVSWLHSTEDIDRTIGRLFLFFGGGQLGPHIIHNVVRAEAYLHVEFHLDPLNRLAIIHQRYRHDRTGQRDNMTVAEAYHHFKFHLHASNRLHQ